MTEEQTGVTDQAAADQATTGETAGAKVEERTVPLHVLEAVRDENKKLKEQRDQFQQTTQPQPAQPAPQQPEAQQPTSPLDGRHPDDLISVADVQKIIEANQASSQAGTGQLQAQLAQVAFMAENPDYKEVLDGLKQQMEASPEFAQLVIPAIQGAQNPRLTAYAIAKGHGIKTGVQNDPLSELDRIIANQERVGSPNGVTSSGGVAGGNQWATMSDADFIKEMRKNGSGF